ncbi:MAG TPA: carboxylesterase family protein [Gaiellaceae bacterium]|nr:carboxylesterase family protein [Gaiellaceae bacterium]
MCAIVMAAALGSARGAAPAAAPTAKTTAGTVRGLVASGMREFLGIPYAAPPLAKLRWQPPQAPARWTKTRNATAFGSSCPQAAGFFGEESTNENCLFLNVYAPSASKNTAKLPVMVWIHGGSLITGEGSDYNPVGLVKQGVVVVTINYRLGLLGFLAHPALSSGSKTHDSGDYGLMDQQFALEWVKHNIAAFGGNPKSVTIFGESAGGLSVRSQLVSPAAKGLFERAITESGSYAETVPTLAQAEAAGEASATAMGCASQTAACLRALPVRKLIAAETALTQLPNISSVLPAQYNAAFASGAFNHVPVISGTNHDEWMLFVALLNTLSNNPVTAANYQQQVATTLELPSAADAAPIVAAYPFSAYPTGENALGAVGTDAIFACNGRLDARSLSKYTPTFQYEFNDENAPNAFLPTIPYSLGAYHASELQYLFPRPVSQLDPDQLQLSAAMQKYWTNFAKTGNPNGAGLPTWPAYTDSSDQAQSLVPPAPQTESNFAAAHKCAIWTPGA